MGFYSIYKIIKDVIRTLFGRTFMKILLFIMVCVICLFVFGEKVFAYNPPRLSYNSDTHYFTYNNNNFKLNDNIFTMPYILIAEDSRDIYSVTIVASDKPFLMSVFGPGYAVRSNVNTSLYTYSYYYNQTSGQNGIKNDTLSKYIHYTGANINATTYYLTQSTILYCNFDIKNYDNPNENIFNSTTYKSPSLANSQSDLENLSFNNFIINANSYSEDISNSDGTLFMLFYNRSLSNSNNTDGLYPIKEKGFTKGSIYTDSSSTDDNLIFNYPIFQSGVFFNIGSTYEIKFAYKTYNNDGTWQYNYFDNNYIFTISSNVTQDYINQLNQQTATSTDEENQQNMQDAINNQTQSIDNINNTISDSSVDTSSIDLPTDNTNDITQSGVDNIFQTIYNSFTSGTPQDIVFPIPFTNKNITLSPNYIYNSLSSNGASWIITLIQAFWWYIISRFIIKDIMSKFRKIKQGNFENIQNSNIREEML